MQNVILSLFNVESEAYQAITEIKNNPATDGSVIVEAALVRKNQTTYEILDGFDIGADAESSHSTLTGTLIGACIGILGGPIGILVGAGLGALAGYSADEFTVTDDEGMGLSMTEQIIKKMPDNELALIALADEADESILDQKLSKYDVTIIRSDAAVIAQEIEKAQELQKDLERVVTKELRDQKKEDKKIEAHRKELKEKMEKNK